MPAGYLMEAIRTNSGKAQPLPAPAPSEPRKRKAPDKDHHTVILEVLNRLKGHPKSVLFLRLRLAPNFSSLEAKTLDHGYESEYEFALEVRRMWTNVFQQFKPGSEEYIAAVELGEFFERLIGRGEGCPGPCPRGNRPRPLTREEKAALAGSIKDLEKPYLRRVVEIVTGGKKCAAREEFEFDLDGLPMEVVQELNTYVQQILEEKKKRAKISPPPPPPTPTTQPSHKESESSSSSSSSSSDSEGDNGIGQSWTGNLQGPFPSIF